MGDNNSPDWSVGLKFVQFHKNTSHHTGIKQAHYKALFGSDPVVGLRSSTLPTEILERMVSEDDLLAAFGNLSTSSNSENPASTSSGSNQHASAAFGSQQFDVDCFWF